MKKKFLALVMTLSMVLSLVPMTALATEGKPTAEPKQETQVEEQEGLDANNGSLNDEETENSVAIHVTMNNSILVSTLQDNTIPCYVEPKEYADQIEFKYNEEQISYFNYRPNEDEIMIAAKEVPDGESSVIQAVYNGEVVGECNIIFTSTRLFDLVDYQASSDVTVSTSGWKVPFAIPVRIEAQWKGNDSFGDAGKEAVVSWDWHSEDSNVVSVAPEEGQLNHETANLTLYQQLSRSKKIYAIPNVMIDGVSYGINEKKMTALTGLYKNIRSMGDGIIYTSEKPNKVLEGDTIEFTLNMPGIENMTSVSWSCDVPGLIDFSDSHSRVARVTINRGVLDVEYDYPQINATVVISGKTYIATCNKLVVYANPIGADEQVSDFDSLKEKLDNGSKELEVTETIEIPQNTTLDLTGVTLYRAKENKNALIRINATGVTIKGGEINGQKFPAKASLIAVSENGNLNLQNITLKNANNQKGEGGAVFVDSAILACSDVTFDNNIASTSDNSAEFCGGGAIYATGSDVRIENSSFIGNEAMYSNGGAIYLDQGSKGMIKNNTFTSCAAVGGLNYNDITNETSDGAGGAIYCRIAGEVGIYDNKIIGCTAERGGGICVRASNESYITIDRNIIQNCKANYRGGGLALINTQANKDEAGADRENNHIKLKRGEISGCTAAWGGGIDYSAHGMNPLYLTNVIITGNSAEATTNQDMGHGGGIWACPVSQTKTYSTLGGAIYGNSAAEGDDVMYEGIDTEDSYALGHSKKEAMEASFMNVSPRALGGGKITWFADYNGEYSAGISEPAKPEMYTNAKNSFGLHGELSRENAIRAEQTKDKLVIADNAATGSICAYGGGIATNSQIVIGLEGHDKSVTVTKSWSQETHPDSATVTLMQKDADNKSVALETVTLNKENQWTYTFKNLPGAYTASNGDVKDYTYSVSETAISGWTASIKEVDDKDNDAKTIAFEITNSPKRGGGSSGGGSITIPDDVPTGLDLKNHYGYIIGYPVDYYTGKPTTDQTKKPVRPEGKITRAEVATIYFRMLTDENRAANWNQVSGFSDVKSSAWYNNAISTLTKAGILKGYEDGTFQPNGYITRAEFATIAIRFFSGVYEGEDLFPDIKGHWAEDYINNAANKGLVKGYEDGTFGPDRYITRAEAVTLVNRTLNRHPHNDGLHQDMLRWPDNMDTSKWYYADMQEATNSHEPDKNKSTADKEYWGKMLPIRDWEALEKEWSNANSAPGEGEVV